mmetsp:Transcript_72932/g.211121  ORF Transcript_72932/g.211121 Transcript_72932/m.211121 type:complete len:331 (-) Transcript_72932:906-1898(-)
METAPPGKGRRKLRPTAAPPCKRRRRGQQRQCPTAVGRSPAMDTVHALCMPPASAQRASNASRQLSDDQWLESKLAACRSSEAISSTHARSRLRRRRSSSARNSSAKQAPTWAKSLGGATRTGSTTPSHTISANSRAAASPTRRGKRHVERSKLRMDSRLRRAARAQTPIIRKLSLSSGVGGTHASICERSSTGRPKPSGSRATPPDGASDGRSRSKVKERPHNGEPPNNSCATRPRARSRNAPACVSLLSHAPLLSSLPTTIASAWRKIGSATKPPCSIKSTMRASDASSDLSAMVSSVLAAAADVAATPQIPLEAHSSIVDRALSRTL